MASVDSDAPRVIAHRGASGYLPEHTLAAKALAHAQGADYLEQDVVASKDGRLVVCHDVFLDRITDVAAVFPGRSRRDGRHYIIDFDWREIERLTVAGDVAGVDLDDEALARQTREARLCTLDEELEFIGALNRVSGRAAGVYPEIKRPRWHAEQGVDLSRAVLETLARHGYDGGNGSAYLQCFDAAELRRIRHELGSALPLVQLVGRSADPRLLTRAGLVAVADYAEVLAPNYRQLLHATGEGGAEAAPLAARARSAGLQLHPYTFNRDALPPYAASLERALELVYEQVRPEAVFCDFPDVAVGVREGLRARAGRR